MNDLQISMIDNQAAAIAKDALDSGDLMVRQLADDTLALIAEVRSLRAKLDAAYYKLEAVPAYAEYCNQWCMRDGSLMTLDEWQAVQP